MSQIPHHLKYTPTHEWLRFDDEQTVTVGITAYAQGLLGDVVFMDLPSIGSEFQAGQDCCVVESVKAASDIYAPLSGKIIQVNEKLSDTPDLINRDPYGEGWIFKMRISDKNEKALLDNQQYEQLTASEGH